MVKRAAWLILVCEAAALVGGCTNPEPPPVSVPAPPAEVFESPQAITRAVLECIQDELKAAAAHDKTEVGRCHERLIAMAAKEDIKRRIASHPMYEIVVGDDVVRGYTELWGPAIAYYAKEFDFDHMLATPDSNDERSVTVRLRASGKEGSTFLAVLCRRDDSGRWGVSRIDFAKPAATQASVAKPAASQPAP